MASSYFTRSIVRPPGFYCALHTRSSLHADGLETIRVLVCLFPARQLPQLVRHGPGRRLQSRAPGAATYWQGMSLVATAAINLYLAVHNAGRGRVPSTVGGVLERGSYMGQESKHNTHSA